MVVLMNKFMREAYKEALKAYKEDEVPVGAVLVCDDRLIAAGHNRCVADNNPTAHAEFLVLQEPEDERLLLGRNARRNV